MKEQDAVHGTTGRICTQETMKELRFFTTSGTGLEPAPTSIIHARVPETSKNEVYGRMYAQPSVCLRTSSPTPEGTTLASASITSGLRLLDFSALLQRAITTL